MNSTIPQIEWNWDDVDYNPSWHDPIVELLSRYIRAGSRIREVGARGFVLAIPISVAFLIGFQPIVTLAIASVLIVLHFLLVWVMEPQEHVWIKDRYADINSDSDSTPSQKLTIRRS